MLSKKNLTRILVSTPGPLQAWNIGTLPYIFRFARCILKGVRSIVEAKGLGRPPEPKGAQESFKQAEITFPGSAWVPLAFHIFQ